MSPLPGRLPQQGKWMGVPHLSPEVLLGGLPEQLHADDPLQRQGRKALGRRILRAQGC